MQQPGTTRPDMEMEKELKIMRPLSISLEKIDLNKYKILNAEFNTYDCSNEIHESRKTSQKNNKCISVQFVTCSYPGCKKFFGRPSRLIVHERTHTGERPFKCHYVNCNKSYTRNFHLLRHISVSHKSSANSSPKESFKCNFCDKIYSNAHSLKKHHVEIHSNENRYSCKECGQSFRKQQHLKTHSFQHTGVKPYKCEHPGCESSFLIPSKLKRHSLSHVNGRYPCPYDECSDKFDTYTVLRHHLSTDHVKICDICGKKFNMYYYEEKNLHSHICSRHNKNFKGYECPICSKWLVTKQKLKHHLTTHDLNKPPKKNSKVPRKPRKDKGVSRTDFAKLLSGYTSDEEKDDNLVEISMKIKDMNLPGSSDQTEIVSKNSCSSTIKL
ncbi:Transcription factor IIIA [Armadillidium nasatum]|uniref:Transcription factor IIIA n=1 Tax=Armadillidium nasatum TaxID=96803 RepID=A0A5N5T562_9CRUS|nr:Transcription factor IIIA [Armadillidium nasatum]